MHLYFFFYLGLNEIIQPLLSLRVKKDHRIPQPNISDQSWPPFSRKEFTEMRRPVPSMIPLHVLLYWNWTKYYRHFKGVGKLSTENGQATRLWYRSSRVLLISEKEKKNMNLNQRIYKYGKNLISNRWWLPSMSISNILFVHCPM